jgi:hypothetical protein
MTNSLTATTDPADIIAVHLSGRCGDVLSPIPGQRWVCVSSPHHPDVDHVAIDGMNW